MGFNWETVLQIVLLIAALRLLHMVTASDSCSEVRRNFVAKRIGQMKLVPYKAFKAKNLRVCPNSGLTCCTRAMETRFQAAAKKDVGKVLKYKTSSLKFNFRSFSDKFQDDVVEVFSLARNSTRRVLHHALRKKVASQANKAAVEELDRLFQALGLQSKEEEVTRAFDRFADKLFLILLDGTGNTTKLEPPYEKCVAKQRVNLHPFMDVPTITAANLTSALRLAQTLHATLAAGAEAVNVTEAAVLTKSCQRSLLKMQYCSHCFGLTLLKPCMGLCRNVLRGCFAGVTELDQYWNYYVGALVDVTELMQSAESKYNLEIALEDFQNKLASSLSVILESITTLRETVEEGCKDSRTSKRSKRSADFPQPEIDDADDDGDKNRKSGGKRRHRQGRRNSSRDRMVRLRTNELSRLKEELPPKQTDAAPRPKVRPPHEVLFNPPARKLPVARVPEQVVRSRKPTGNLHARIKRFITSLNLSINFYRYLPDDMCTSRLGTIEVVNRGKCWDGSSIVGEYPKDVVPTGYGKQASNPEVKVLRVEKGVIKAIEKLRIATKSLLLTAEKDVPGILLHAPEYERREDEEKKEREQFDWPCDDEDDCDGEVGSGESDLYTDFKLPPSRKHGNRKKTKLPISPYDQPMQKPSAEDEVLLGEEEWSYNDTAQIDVTIGDFDPKRGNGRKRVNGGGRKGPPRTQQRDSGETSQNSGTEKPPNSALSMNSVKLITLPCVTLCMLLTRLLASLGVGV